VLDVEEWAEIRRLHLAEKVPIKEIARRLGLARNTVRTAVRSGSPPVFDRKPRPSAVDAVEPRIRELLGEFPRMPATVIAERIGWDRSVTILKDRVRELRPCSCHRIRVSGPSISLASSPSGICGSRRPGSRWATLRTRSCR